MNAVLLPLAFGLGLLIGLWIALDIKQSRDRWVKIASDWRAFAEKVQADYREVTIDYRTMNDEWKKLSDLQAGLIRKLTKELDS